MKGIPEHLIKEYVDKIPSRYETEIKSAFLSETCDRKKVEENVRKAYELEGGTQIKEFVWIQDPVVAKKVQGENEFTYPSYFNINWLFFFKTYYEMLTEHKSELTEEFDHKFFEENKKTYEQSCCIFEAMKDIFGINEIDGVVYIIEKPKKINIVENELHSLEGPSVLYGNNGDADLYHIEGVEMTPQLWASIVKSIKEEELLNDGVDVKSLKKHIKFLEKKFGKIKTMDVEGVFKIENLEQKSKAVKYMGYDKIIDMATVLDEETVTTHKGETKTYQLFEIDLGLEVDDRGNTTSEVKSRFVKVSCWSTDRDYILQVDPRSEQCNTAMGAVAWTCKNPVTNERCSVEEYREIMSET